MPVGSAIKYSVKSRRWFSPGEWGRPVWPGPALLPGSRFLTAFTCGIASHDEVLLQGLEGKSAGGQAGDRAPEPRSDLLPALPRRPRTFVLDCPLNDRENGTSEEPVNACDNSIPYTDHMVAEMIAGICSVRAAGGNGSRQVPP